MATTAIGIMEKNQSKWNAKITFDGGSRGNPGPAAGAAIIKYQGETYTNTRFLPYATNNKAEYTGCILGLEKALELGCKQIAVSGDSKLIINQLNGSYQVKSPDLRNYYNQASALLKQFEKVSLIWIPRNQNSAADQAVNACINKNTGVSHLREKALDLPTVAVSGKKSPIKAPKKKLTGTDKKELGLCSFVKGEYIRVQAEGHSKNGMIGIVCENPSLNSKGKSWLLKVEIEGVPFPICLEEFEVVAALPEDLIHQEAF